MSKKILLGLVEKKSLGGTLVAVSYTKRHHRYQKVVRRTRRFLTENPIGAVPGETVEIEESRPLSKVKHFVIRRRISEE